MSNRPPGAPPPEPGSRSATRSGTTGNNAYANESRQRPTRCARSSAPGRLHLATDADRYPRRADEIDAVAAHPARRRSPCRRAADYETGIPRYDRTAETTLPMTARMDDRRTAPASGKTSSRSPEAISCAEGGGIPGAGAMPGPGIPYGGSVNYSYCPTDGFAEMGDGGGGR